MSTKSLVDKIESLPPEKKAEVEDFVEFVAAGNRPASLPPSASLTNCSEESTTGASACFVSRIESVSLSLVGLSGAALVSGITLLAGQAFPDDLSVSPMGLMLSALFALAIGLSAGVYPVLRAARLTPADAIRAL